jgi:hypothetical protein
VVWGKEGKERVVEVRPGDGPAQLHKMGQVKRIVDQDMGFVPLADGASSVWCGVGWGGVWCFFLVVCAALCLAPPSH